MGIKVVPPSEFAADPQGVDMISKARHATRHAYGR